MLAVVVADVELQGEYQFKRQYKRSINPAAQEMLMRNALLPRPTHHAG
jgi:hypothetical protein